MEPDDGPVRHTWTRMDSTTFAILVALVAGRRSAPAIHQELQDANGGRSIAVATFYRRLNAALTSGWIIGHEESAAGRGRPGKRYSLSAAGTAAVRAEAHRVRRLAELALRDEAPR